MTRCCFVYKAPTSKQTGAINSALLITGLEGQVDSLKLKKKNLAGLCITKQINNWFLFSECAVWIKEKNGMLWGKTEVCSGRENVSVEQVRQ